MNALALFGASFSVPLFATFVRSEKARNELTIVASFAAIGMPVSVLALIDDSRADCLVRADGTSRRLPELRQPSFGCARPLLAPPAGKLAGVFCARSCRRVCSDHVLKPPGFILPCQPALADRPPSGPGWLHEIKFDGYRVIARKDGERVRLWARTTSDYSNTFTRIRNAVAALPVESSARRD